MKKIRSIHLRRKIRSGDYPPYSLQGSGFNGKNISVLTPPNRKQQ